MPFSDSQGKDVILGWVKEINPKVAVLDVGAGSGTYADLLRPHISPQMFDAIEIWTPYINKYLLEYKYDYVYRGDVRRMDDEDPLFYEAWELVIMGDVIEHMTKDDAKRTILKFAHAAGTDNIIISFPVLHLEQGQYEGNPYETHVDHWTYDEMLEFLNTEGIKVNAAGHGDVLAWFWLDTSDLVW